MGYLKPAEFKTLPLPTNPQYWVRLRTNVRWENRLASEAAMLQISAERRAASKANGAEAEVDIQPRPDWSTYQRQLVLGFIDSWNLTDENDEPLPLTLESLSVLEDKDGQALAAYATGQMEGSKRGVEAEKNLGRNSRRQSSTTRR